MESKEKSIFEQMKDLQTPKNETHLEKLKRIQTIANDCLKNTERNLLNLKKELQTLNLSKEDFDNKFTEYQNQYQNRIKETKKILEGVNLQIQKEESKF